MTSSPSTDTPLSTTADADRARTTVAGPVMNLLRSHRSIRKFTDEAIDPALLEDLIRAGQAAATSSHLQATTVIRVRDRAKRERLASLGGEQPYIAGCAEFLVFCGDLKRIYDSCERLGVEPSRGMTEQFIIATVDTSLFAQNVVVAAEAAGLGICYIGGLRNHPQEISDLLELPDHVYPVFGLCLGYPRQDPEVKPRLPVSVILKEDRYDDAGDAEAIAGFDREMEHYYRTRTGGKKVSNWTQQVSAMFTGKTRPHMRGFLARRGFTFE